MAINSYPKVHPLGHRMIADILKGPVLVQEKVDGSQFSFGIINGELMCRSKGQQLVLDAPEKMFARAVEVVKSIAHLLQPGWIYRGEYLSTPKHNTLVYDRVPHNHIILFDVEVHDGQFYVAPEELGDVAGEIGLEAVPTLYYGEITDIEMFRELLDTVSILGGQKIEGAVVKNYNVFTLDGKIAIGKFVSERFKEIHGGAWREKNPTQGDILDHLILRYRTPARWDKAIQHLVEAGELEGSPRDIGKLIIEVPEDIKEEEEDVIKQILFDHFWPKVRRGVTAGLADYYKERLLERAFE